MATDNNSRLAFAGPPHPDHGFPLWFEDANGTRLELGLSVPPDPLTPAIGELPNPGAPMAFPGNFPDESFYYMAEARLPVGGAGITGRGRVILALEAAFGAAGVPLPGMNVVFARMRVRIDDVVPGAEYVVTHPYGVTDPLVADDRGRVFYTEDFGIVEGDCTAVLRSGRIAPFLIATAAAPAGYVGDGVTEQEVTGSPFGTNFVSIAGPRIGAGGGLPDPAHPGSPDHVWTNLFTVQGRLARQVGAEIASATYARTIGQIGLSLLARSAPAQSLELTGDGLRVALLGNGRDYAALAQMPALPANLQLINVGDAPPTRMPIAPTDLVIVEAAIHDVAAATLLVRARSSDDTATLTLMPFNLPLATNPQSFAGLAATPAEVTVVSNRGGSGRQRVELTGAPGLNLGVAANAVSPVAGRVGETMTLDGTGSRGATAFAWTQTAGTPVVLAGVNTATPSFTPALAGPLAFTLTVQGTGGPQSATVAVTIDPPLPADILAVDRAEYRTGTRQFRISGTVSNSPNAIVVSIGGTELGRAIPDITGAWSLRRNLLAAEAALVPGPGSTLLVASRTATRTAPVSIRN